MADVPTPNPQQVIDESRPMIDAFLAQIGVRTSGQPLATQSVLHALSDWIDRQPVDPEKFWHLASRVAAFICEYLIEGKSAVRHIREGRIYLRIPVDVAKGTYREFDPYEVAVHLVNERKNLEAFMKTLDA